jgi:hypothetical protein
LFGFGNPLGLKLLGVRFKHIPATFLNLEIEMTEIANHLDRVLTPPTLEEVIADAWRRHEAEPRQVHEALVSVVDLVGNDEQLRAFSRLMTHLHAEHLDDRAAAWPPLEALRERFEATPSLAYRPATVSIETLQFVDGNDAGLTRLSIEERASVLATSASALAWKKQLISARVAFERALDEASAGLPDGSPALRALAVAGNNLAVRFEQAETRSTHDDVAMVRFADAALSYWSRAGGWIEQERANYRCARSRLQAGRPAEAVEFASACLSLCEQHDAPAYERFFACSVLALACHAAEDPGLFARWRDRARSHYEALDSAERSACEQELAELNAQ